LWRISAVFINRNRHLSKKIGLYIQKNEKNGVKIQKNEKNYIQKNQKTKKNEKKLQFLYGRKQGNFNFF
jgi:hypothetical protein